MGRMILYILFYFCLILPVDSLLAKSLGVLAVNDSCFIDGDWYERGETNPTNCYICDPDVNQEEWTQRTDVCEAYGFCYDHETQHPAGCAWCDTVMSKTFWTIESGKCLIGDRCYDSAYRPGTGCNEYCDPSRSQTSWTIPGDSCVIGFSCVPPGTRSLTLCGECVPEVSKSSWTLIPGCYNIVFTALKDAHDGNFGSVEVADRLCAKQAAMAGMPGVWKAFISSPERDVRDLIKTHAVGTEVVNLFGTLLYDNWSDMFSQSSWFGNVQIFAFNYYWIDVIGYKSYAWHGSNPDGTYRPDCACQDWTSNLATDSARHGDLRYGIWLSENVISCDSQLAVACIRIDSNLVTSADGHNIVPEEPKTVILSGNYPNPFNLSTTIEFILNRRQVVEIAVFNLLGQKVRILEDGFQSVGTHRVYWDGRDDHGNEMPTGVYLYRLKTESHVITKKMVLLK